MTNNKFLSKLSQNLLEILNDEEYYDITVEVGNDPDKNDGTLTHIKLPNILPEIFQIILRYIYGGEISLVDYDILDIVKILVVANELSLQELIPHLQSFLIKNKENWLEQNFNLIYQMSLENDTFLDLQIFFSELISKYPERIFNLPDFTSISEKALISLIRHDKIQMNEVKVWEYVLKWGIAQNSELSSDPSNYSNDDFNVLKDTLQHCIPFMKFFNLTSREFLNNVFPYRKILPNDNRRSIKKVIDSKIISTQHVEIISKWIDGLEITDESKNLYEFKLIFRGSRDGFKAERFHELCDNQARTVTIIKVKDTDEILGGYNPIEWKNEYGITSRYNTTIDSFIFSFEDKENIENCIISRVKFIDCAINYWHYYGLSFGNGDLKIYDGSVISLRGGKTGCCVNSSYKKLIRKISGLFSLEDYEVFQIINDN
ncbi:carbohydrate-binding module family 13 protein [Rhizophagus clarus]|uniref:Carbohydrate-binding module family 13 protein n=1 Tax=Rhizophagus clarus TaxID=94130 RepID=A0A8H3QL38_9GLOM|nr:carbohydrate-binding module family 13 protein [Rhizophagus clarus]